ncbi:MAG TPA: ATP synthase subunit I [Thiolinea sp.]|nr:ATP synthase subunit I [Thiolinea sp.]
MRVVGSIQILIMLVGALVAWNYLGTQAVLPALFGGSIALANTMLLASRIKKAGELAKDDPQSSVNTLYVGMAQRIVFVLVAMGVGLGLLKLMPLPLVGVFMAAQLAYVLAGSQKIEV